MSNHRSELIKLINLMEGIDSKVELETIDADDADPKTSDDVIDENQLEDISIDESYVNEDFSSWIKDKLAGGKDRFLSALGNKLATGKVNASNFANDMMKNYRIWLGQIGEPADEVTLAEFLYALKFPVPAIKATFDRMGLEMPGPTNESFKGYDIYESFLDEDLDRSELGQFFKTAANVAYKSGIVGRNGRISPSNYKDSKYSTDRSDQDQSNAPTQQNTRVEPTLDKAEPKAAEQSQSQAQDEPVKDQSLDALTKGMLKYLKNGGVGADEINDLRHSVMSVRGLKDISDAADQKMLSAIGFAFLKARSGG